MANIIAAPDFEGQKQLLLDEMDRIRPELEHAQGIIDEMLQDVPEVGRSFDARDLLPMSLLIPPGVLHDVEIRNMCLDFVSDDPSRKAQWLDSLYSFREGVEVPSLDPSKPEDMATAVRCFALNQTVGTMATSNSAYYQARYADPVHKEKTLLQDQTQVDMGYLLQTIATQEGKPLNLELTLPLNPLGVAAAQQSLENSLLHYQVRALGAQPSMATFTATADFSLFAHTKIDSIQPVARMAPIEDQDKLRKRNVWQAVGNAFNHLDMSETKGVSRDELILIDGKSVASIIDSKNMTLNKAQRGQMSAAVIATALASGKNRVDAVFLRTGDGGKMEAVTQPIKPDLTALGNTIAQDYGPIHRTFFNWGPWKCKTRAQKAEDLYAKPVSSAMQAKLQAETAKIAAKAEGYVVPPKVSFMDAYAAGQEAEHTVEHTSEHTRELGAEAATTTTSKNPQRTATNLQELKESTPTATAQRRLSQTPVPQLRAPDKEPPGK